MALEALRGDKTIQEIAARHKVHPSQASTWKQRAVEGMKDVFTKGAERGRGDHEAEIRDLHAKIGELTLKRDFWPKGSSSARDGRAGSWPWACPGSPLEPFGQKSRFNVNSPIFACRSRSGCADRPRCGRVFQSTVPYIEKFRFQFGIYGVYW